MYANLHQSAEYAGRLRTLLHCIATLPMYVTKKSNASSSMEKVVTGILTGALRCKPTLYAVKKSNGSSSKASICGSSHTIMVDTIRL